MRGRGYGVPAFYLARNLIRGAHPARNNRADYQNISPEDIHGRLLATFEWLKLAFQATGGNGFSKGYHAFSGWMEAYPETSGYIISSLLEYHRVFGDVEARRIAIKAGQWLLTQQNPDGGIPAVGFPGGASLAFDTGMVLHGFLDLHAVTGDEAVATAASRCASYLCDTQNPDGSWTNCYQGIPHAYHARVSWPLLIFANQFNDTAARDCAIRNIQWVLARQNENGDFSSANFTRRIPFANTHSLGYIMEGLLEAYRLTGQTEWIAGVKKTADILLEKAAKQSGFLPGYFNSEWQEVKILPFSFACLTGIAQIARCWLLLYRICSDEKYLEGARLSMQYVSQFQDIEITHPGIRGAIPGSAPIAGGYLPFQYPNWAQKFWMDLLFDLRAVLS